MGKLMLLVFKTTTTFIVSKMKPYETDMSSRFWKGTKKLSVFVNVTAKKKVGSVVPLVVRFRQDYYSFTICTHYIFILQHNGEENGIRWGTVRM